MDGNVKVRILGDMMIVALGEDYVSPGLLWSPVEPTVCGTVVEVGGRAKVIKIGDRVAVTKRSVERSGVRYMWRKDRTVFVSEKDVVGILTD